MTAKIPRSTRSRRTAIAVGVVAALTGILAGCGHSGTTASHSAASTPATTTAVSTPATTTTGAAPAAGTGTDPTLHMITNEGHRLAFHVTPGHRPAIVLDAGGGLDSSYWKDIVPVLAKKTGSEIITYDREGMGASDTVPGPWKVRNAVSDLETGLTELGATRDVILVAHSEAGEIATYLTSRHPGQFAGAVLVDAALPQFSTDTEIARVAAATQAQVDALKGHPVTKADRQLLAVAPNYTQDQHAYHRMTWPTGVPATVIVSEETPFPTSAPDAKAWRTAQAEFAEAAPNRHLVTAAHSSHDIPVDRPDLVEAQIEAMANTVG
ncbi:MULTISPECIES: alpha/beta fold hydrolase [unclassified Streptomyces]|uniref:alpha/beta fold hydrolase n=1 Tax=unclassified Streptomyces TaxID=2593676 RepID=UPI002E292727|nr:alpha/beta hydrolase [Streptomyces sp. NBC_00223]